MKTQTIKADKRIERYLRAAKAAGMPADQVKRFIESGYVGIPSLLPFHAQARQADKHNGPDELALGGTRYAAKSHAAMAQVGLDDCQRFPGLKVLYLRKVQKSASEAFEDLVEKVFRYVPHTYTNGIVRFPNDSRILIGGYNNDRDIEKYIGIEYDGAVIEEVSQLAQDKIQRIYGSIRTTRSDYRTRKYLTTNYEGVGYSYFKQHFIVPWRNNTQTWTWFLHCTWKDNPFATDEYVRYLNSLTGPLAKAWRDGDMDAFEGMAFPDWQHERHVIRPFEIPYNFPRWRAMDYGFVHPFSAGWFAKDVYTGRVYVYREAVHQLLSPKMQARVIKELTPPTELINITYASPDMWARKADKDGKVTTTAQEFADEGVYLTKADNDRLGGVRRLHSLLADLPDGQPGLQVFSTCPRLIACMEAMVSDPNNPEDVLKVNADPSSGEGGDDPYDMLRYGMTNTAIPAPPTEHTNIKATSPLVDLGNYL